MNKHDRPPDPRVGISHLNIINASERHQKKSVKSVVQKSRLAARATTDINSVSSTGLAR
jgi:hypothetical protein